VPLRWGPNKAPVFTPSSAPSGQETATDSYRTFLKLDIHGRRIYNIYVFQYHGHICFFRLLFNSCPSLTMAHDEHGSDGPEPIAVVGLSFKFAGNGDNADSFWDMLLAGRCAAKDIPPDRFNADSFYHPDTSRLDTVW
jgi:hypothetical protein